MLGDGGELPEVEGVDGEEDALLEGSHLVHEALEPLDLDHQEQRKAPHAHLLLVWSILPTLHAVKLIQVCLIHLLLIGVIEVLQDHL